MIKMAFKLRLVLKLNYYLQAAKAFNPQLPHCPGNEGSSPYPPSVRHQQVSAMISKSSHTKQNLAELAEK